MKGFFFPKPISVVIDTWSLNHDHPDPENHIRNHLAHEGITEPVKIVKI
jgi:hypothetical protein